MTLRKRPLDDRRGEDGIGGAGDQRRLAPGLRETSPDDKRFEPAERGEEAAVSRVEQETHALANSPEMATADTITGPSSTSRLFRTRGLIHSLLGSVTPADSTWMPRTTRVNWCQW